MLRPSVQFSYAILWMLVGISGFPTGQSSLSLLSTRNLLNSKAEHRREDSLVDVSGLSVAQTSFGLVKAYTGNPLAFRFTVPYAQAPLGDLRWKDPIALTGKFSANPHSKWFDGTGLPAPCPQDASDIISNTEDCLFLTIYAPRFATNASQLPVLVWVHGGSFTVGSSSMSGLDGSKLASKENVVVVMIQYRLGALGFLKFDRLSISGNYGLKDLILALTFIQQNIASFGGNPTQVTLAGQSSGAEMVKSLLVTPSATSLFQRAILHSAPLNAADQTVSIANQIGGLLISDWKSKSLSALKKLSVETILASQASLFSPGSRIYVGDGSRVEGVNIAEPLRVCVDESLVTRQFGEVVQRTGDLISSTGKNIIFTSTKDEAAEFVTDLLPPNLPASAFASVVQASLGPSRAQSVLDSELYDPAQAEAMGDTDATRNEIVQLVTDYNWACPIQQTAVNLSLSDSRSQTGGRMYMAQFDLGIPYYTTGTGAFFTEKVSHQDDIYAVFNTSPNVLSAAQSNLVNEVQSRWGSFLRTGDPNRYDCFTPSNASVSTSHEVWNPVQKGNALNALVLGYSIDGGSRIFQTLRPLECAVGTGFWGRIVPFDEQIQT